MYLCSRNLWFHDNDNQLFILTLIHTHYENGLKYYYYIDKNGGKVYTWDPNATDDMPARKSLRAKGNDWIKETEYGQLFFDMEKRMEQIAR